MTNRLNRTLIICESFILVNLFISSCNSNSKNNVTEKKYSIQKSQIDAILGDKIINVETGELRKDNFKNLLKIRKDQLKTESILYKIKQLDNYHFVLSQKMNYADSRNFNILIKTNDIFITD